MRSTFNDRFKFSCKLLTAMTLFMVAASSSAPQAIAESAQRVTNTNSISGALAPEVGSNTMRFRGYIGRAISPVRLAGEEVFTVNAPAGGFSAEERSIIIERNLNNAIMAAHDRSPNAVSVVVINHLPVIRVGGKHVLTVDTNLASAYGTPPFQLAESWAARMKGVLADSAKVKAYIAQLGGDFLYSPYSPPYRKAQWIQARLNHASNEARMDMPLDLVSSASLRDDGFEQMMQRNPVAAEILFRQALGMEVGNQRAHYGLGLSLLKQGKVDEAIGELQMARWLDHDDAQVHLALGEALESKGLDQDAITRYREAAFLHPEDPAPALFIADMRESRDDIDHSVRELTAALNNNPSSQYLRLRRQDQIAWRLTKPY